MDIAAHHLTVPKTARYYTSGEPGPDTRSIWIVCHGYGQLASRFLTLFSNAGASDRVFVAPEALSRFYLDSELPHTSRSRIGATWMTREDRDSEILDIVSYLDAVCEDVLQTLDTSGGNRDGVHINCLGFSQGAAAVCRWAAQGASHIDRLVVWGSSIPEDVNPRALIERRPRLMVDLVYGTDDPAIDRGSVDAHRKILAAVGLNPRIVEFEGGHVIDKATLAAVVSHS